MVTQRFLLLWSALALYPPTPVVAQWEFHEETAIQGTVSGTIRRGHVFRTTSGNLYEVTSYTYQYVYAYRPSVIVLRQGDLYRLSVDGFNQSLICRKLNEPGELDTGGDPAIRRIQQALTLLGYPPGPLDGQLGFETKRQLTAFQSAASLTATGLPDPPTLRALADSLANRAPPDLAGLELATQLLEAAQALIISEQQQVLQQLYPIPDILDTPDVIESRIDGDFEGWDGDTVFKLQNGQIWEQVSYAYRYHYAYSPGVLIYKTAGAYRLKVDGVDQTIIVRRLH